VSASIDGTLRLWDIDTGVPLRIFSSHVNKQLFVGLGVHSREWITTGSEDNQVVTYHRDFEKPVFQYSFNSSQKSFDNDFVSALCYHKTENAVLAATNRGLVQVLQLK